MRYGFEITMYIANR
ncbi:pyrroloquinoline quinone precursor peptide PqqA [Cupriavidus basilensis]|nr:pyrroloquinoline quinone precursor peptide PqqA [Cupriavidus basilensis]